MGNEIAGYPVQEVEFTKAGKVHDAAQVQALHTMITGGHITDLLVLAHGWNNDADEARSLYTDWLTALAHAPTTLPAKADRKVGVLAVLWPSKKFVDPGETAGRGAGLTDQGSDLADHIDALDGIAAKPTIARLAKLSGSLEDSAKARDEFVETLVNLLGDHAALDGESSGEVPRRLFDKNGDLLAELGTPATAGLGHWIGGKIAGARNLLNYVTYYAMKTRAGDVGRKGLAGVLTKVRGDVARVHMVGHSFGCRLIAASLLGDGAVPAPTVSSMVLVQAAFSHNGFARHYDGTHDGFFRSVVAPRRVTGPISITHSKHDTAVGIAYPLAARIIGANPSDFAIGGRDDPFGGMGHNGARKTPEAVDTDMRATGTYAGLAQQTVVNVRADDYIRGHSDVRGPQVADLIAQTMAATT